MFWVLKRNMFWFENRKKNFFFQLVSLVSHLSRGLKSCDNLLGTKTIELIGVSLDIAAFSHGVA